MAFAEQYRVDLGFGGTSFGYEVRKTVDGEIFNCYGNGTIDQLFIPNDKNEVVITHLGFGEDVLNAKYTFGGNLTEVGVFLKPYYDQFIEMDGIFVDPSIKKDIASLTNDGTDPFLLYINLPLIISQKLSMLPNLQKVAKLYHYRLVLTMTRTRQMMMNM